MAVSPEISRAITEFFPKDGYVLSPVDLGTVQTDQGEEYDVKFGPYSFEARIAEDPEQRASGLILTQPVVALVSKDGRITPLPYATNVRGLPDGLAEQVAATLVPPQGTQPRP